jgi:hypothetical protein
MLKKPTHAAKDESQTAAAASSRTAARPNTAAPPNVAIAREAVARLAFQKWQKRGCPIGTDQRDWFEAEVELKSR